MLVEWALPDWTRPARNNDLDTVIAAVMRGVPCQDHTAVRGRPCSGRPASVCVGRVVDAGLANLVSGPELAAVMQVAGLDPLAMIGAEGK